METIKAIYKTKYAKFDGRAGRREFWTFLIWYWVVMVVISMIARLIGDTLGVVVALIPNLILIVFALGSLVPALALRFRRLHDINKSAWWLLLGVIPLIGALVLLVFDFLPGTVGRNDFGPDPKGLDTTEAAEVFA